MVTLLGLWINNGSGPVRNPELSDEEFDSGLEALKQSNLNSLWQAAHDYEYAEISGSAVGLLVLGVLQSKPRCAAVQNWISSIWTLYYARKSIITYEWDQTLYDFSSCGPIPYTCPELMEELGF
jgi:hypothetical protein